ncbi:MutS protein 1 [Recurvomyces mirabilis]|uniref:MutS protein 1 n=1 Tax=Recurvomyces mirabilis TaxID=574656 RepID=A0AAE0WPX3_9PEZI|nr:MutS protein 1 [Recurvomyces mirabilis]KAK5155892.1 MutS protein 1 [Recurvomyces mirabilis]
MRLRTSLCSAAVRLRSVSARPTLHEPRPLRPHQSAVPTTWQRGAKTKTTVKASSLPQGILPPLPPDESEKVQARSYPPVLQQHLNNVRKFTDCVVLTRVGDFYEMYFDQVDEYAPLVNLKRAKRATALGDVAMAGFQHTQLDRYLKMFVQDLGKQVAISEQIRLPDGERIGKGPMYDRKVTRVVTAGTLIDENFMDPFENNYLLAVHFDGVLPSPTGQASDKGAYERYARSMKVGLSWVDLSSGEFNTQISDLATLPSLIARICPREIVLDAGLEDAGQPRLQKHLGDGNHAMHFHAATTGITKVSDWTPMLERAVADDKIGDFASQEIAAGSQVLDYIREKLVVTNLRLQPPTRKSDEEYMSIDKQSLRGLEIRSTLRDGTLQGSLLHAVRHTVTKSGARLLSQRLVAPSMSLSMINDRLDLIQELLSSDALREDIVALLRQTADTLRLLQRFSIGKGDADDLLNLARTVDVMGQVAELLHDHIIARQEPLEVTPEEPNARPMDLDFLWDILHRLDLEGPAKLARVIEDAIDEESLTRQHTIEAEQQEEAESVVEGVIKAEEAGEEAPKRGKRASKATPKTTEETSSEIWIMRRDASKTLERAHADLDKLVQMKSELAAGLRNQLKSESLTLRWSAQLGHFCHIKGKDANGNLAALAGARVIGSTKSTRSFYLADWTHLGVRIDDCKLRVRTEEERVFGKLRAQVIDNLMKLRRNAAVLDELDVACSSATIAKERNLVRPILNETTTHHIIGGRHPTVDLGLKTQGRPFTSNDCTVGDKEKIYLITGPNMAGKSTYLRQNALVTILAQTGLFVPADYASIGLVDKIFSRVGSADNLYQDQSTFMVEMLETAEILKQATPRSFVIMDEVGRGTTPEDGIAVGYACLHHLHHVNRCRALFATHFHALADMTRDFEKLACYCTDVAEETDGSWAYVHKLRRGVNRESHALKVAKLAGLPEEAVQVAKGVLDSLGHGQQGRRSSEAKKLLVLALAEAGTNGQ